MSTASHPVRSRRRIHATTSTPILRPAKPVVGVGLSPQTAPRIGRLGRLRMAWQRIALTGQLGPGADLDRGRSTGVRR